MFIFLRCKLLKMSEFLLDELEEGEILDDIVPEPIVKHNLKPLPRRYVINDKKLKSRHRKKTCKHTPDHHKKKSSKSNFYSNSKSPIKHRKKCPKHSKPPFSHDLDNEFIDGSNFKVSQHSHKNLPIIKSAFKNFRSPPRKVLNIDNSKLAPQHKNVDSNYSKSKHKNSPNSLNKLQNIININDLNSPPNEKQLGKGSNEKNESFSMVKCENLPPIEVIEILDDDEDEEELRRIALATCLKRSPITPEILSEDTSSKNNYSESEIPANESDNYEIVDMDVDEESECADKVDDLFVIDTTPACNSEQNAAAPVCIFNPHLNLNHIDNGVVNGFLPNINIEDNCQNFNSVFCENLNNDLYTNFEVDNSRLPPNRVDDEFEEELLRAELIANMKSMRQNSDSLHNQKNILSSKNEMVEAEFTNSVVKETRVVKFKSDACNADRIINIDRDVSSNDFGFKDERTVSIIKDRVVTETPFVIKSRAVSSFVNPILPSTGNLSVRKGAEIKVKLNNVHSVATSVPNIITLPQERIIISLNNETSSDDSDQEDDLQIKQPEKNLAVASLEALISNARLESDGKKNSSNNVNGASDALSCLSKAQQEEYNSLIKILAKKKEPYAQSSTEEVKKVTEDANLILLRKKIIIAKDNYQKERALMNTAMKELVKKKRAYMLSKIKTQQLKEQLVAAEKVRKTNLQIWTKCAGEIQTLKKSVSKRQALINSLQNKISSCFPETVSNGLSSLSNNTTEQEYLHR